MSTCEAIKALALKGWSGRRIARELAVNRETVARYLVLSKPAIPPPGSAPPPESNPAIPPLGSEDTGTGSAPKPAIPPLGSPAGGRSLCEVHLAEITLAIEQGLSAHGSIRIWSQATPLLGATRRSNASSTAAAPARSFLSAVGRVSPATKPRSITVRVPG